MSAEEFNRIRRILFSTVHDQRRGFTAAYDYLEGYRNKLGPASYAGLKAEIAFYQQYGQEFSLTVAGDMGEHADFAGKYGSEVSRFDVTTNISFKNFSDYEPYMGRGPRYKIALLDQGNFDVIDVYDLAFRRCESCGGYRIPSVALLDQNYNRHGESTWTNDQLLFDICSGCHEWTEKERLTHSGLFSPQEYFDNIDEPELGAAAAERHTIESYKYLRREFDDHLMSVAQHRYMVTEPKGGGYWALHLAFKNEAVAIDLPEEIECGHIL